MTPGILTCGPAEHDLAFDPEGRWPGLLATMQRDKKARAGMMRFIVLDEVGKTSVLAGPEEALLFAAYQEVGV